MTEAKRECCDTAVNEYHFADCQRPGKGEPFDGPKRTWCCGTMVLDPHEAECPFDPEAFKPDYNPGPMHREALNREHVDELNAHRPGWDRKPIWEPRTCCDTWSHMSHRQGCDWAASPVRHEVVRGRASGKMNTYNRLVTAQEACGPDAHVAPTFRVIGNPPIWQYEDRRAVDRSFENEVRLHG